MKTIAKICCIVLVAGLVMTGVGYAFGGRPLYHDAWARFAGRYLPVSIGSHVSGIINDSIHDSVDGIVGDIATGITDEITGEIRDGIAESFRDGYDWNDSDWNGSVYGQDWDRSLKQAMSAALGGADTEHVRKIDLELSEGEYIIMEADGDIGPFSVDCASAIRMDSGLKDRDTWYVKARGNRTDTPILIYLPKDFTADEIELSIGAGSLQAGALSARKFELEVGVAEAAIASLSFTEKADIEVGAGYAEITLAKPWQSYGYDLEAGLGDINVNDETVVSGVGEASRDGTPHLSAEVGAGSLYITTP